MRDYQFIFCKIINSRLTDSLLNIYLLIVSLILEIWQLFKVCIYLI